MKKFKLRPEDTGKYLQIEQDKEIKITNYHLPKEYHYRACYNNEYAWDSIGFFLLNIIIHSDKKPNIDLVLEIFKHVYNKYVYLKITQNKQVWIEKAELDVESNVLSINIEEQLSEPLVRDHLK